MTKRLKAELVAALSMLIIAALMLTTASFAWMTISTNAAVSNVAVDMGVSGNMEIAKASTGAFGEIEEVTADDHASQHTWGAKVTDFTSAKGINFPTKVSGGAYYTTAYDENGRTAGVTQLLEHEVGTMEDGVVATTANLANVSGGSVNIEKTIAAGYGVWIRTNQNLTDVAFTITGTPVVKRVTTGGTRVSVPELASYVKVNVVLCTFAATTAKDTPYDDDNSVVLNSGDKFELQANVPALAIINVSIDGEKLVASDFTSGAALSIEGVSIKFESDQLKALEGNHGVNP